MPLPRWTRARDSGACQGLIRLGTEPWTATGEPHRLLERDIGARCPFTSLSTRGAWKHATVCSPPAGQEYPCFGEKIRGTAGVSLGWQLKVLPWGSGEGLTVTLDLDF